MCVCVCVCGLSQREGCGREWGGGRGEDFACCL